MAAGRIPQLHDLAPVGDNLSKWQFKLKDFDSDCEGESLPPRRGRALPGALVLSAV